MSWITGVGLTPFGRIDGSSTLGLMSAAAQDALQDAGCERESIDGLLCGYSTTLPHLMLSTVFAEHFGLRPAYAQAVQLGGATGLALVMLADRLVAAGAADRILVVAGENRLTGQSRESSIQALAQVGHPVYEVPLGPSVPAYYALLASRYLHDHRIGEAELAELAVLMRRHAARHPGAHFTEAITVDDVMASTPIATPLKRLDCCPISDGGAACIVSRAPGRTPAVRIRGGGQAHLHQHVTRADPNACGAAVSARRACAAAGVALDDVRYAAIYDSFTITLVMLLEEIGLVPRAEACDRARAGYFDCHGDLPLNTHGGLLSYGHCGVAGILAHVVEACRQLTGRAGQRQARDTPLALVHADGGVLSSHVTVVLERTA